MWWSWVLKCGKWNIITVYYNQSRHLLSDHEMGLVLLGSFQVWMCNGSEARHSWKRSVSAFIWMFTLTTFLKIEFIYSSWWRWWQCSDRLNSSWHDALRLFDCSTISPQFVFPPSLIMFASLLLQLASPPDPASAAGQTATSSREKSWSSTWGRSRPRKANRCTAVWYVNKIQMSHNCLQSLLECSYKKYFIVRLPVLKYYNM